MKSYMNEADKIQMFLMTESYKVLFPPKIKTLMHYFALKCGMIRGLLNLVFLAVLALIMSFLHKLMIL